MSMFLALGPERDYTPSSAVVVADGSLRLAGFVNLLLQRRSRRIAAIRIPGTDPYGDTASPRMRRMRSLCVTSPVPPVQHTNDDIGSLRACRTQAPMPLGRRKRGPPGPPDLLDPAKPAGNPERQERRED